VIQADDEESAVGQRGGSDGSGCWALLGLLLLEPPFLCAFYKRPSRKKNRPTRRMDNTETKAELMPSLFIAIAAVSSAAVGRSSVPISVSFTATRSKVQATHPSFLLVGGEFHHAPQDVAQVFELR
jgi:hypothetical protein